MKNKFKTIFLVELLMILLSGAITGFLKNHNFLATVLTTIVSTFTTYAIFSSLFYGECTSVKNVFNQFRKITTPIIIVKIILAGIGVIIASLGSINLISSAVNLSQGGDFTSTTLASIIGSLILSSILSMILAVLIAYNDLYLAENYNSKINILEMLKNIFKIGIAKVGLTVKSYLLYIVAPIGVSLIVGLFLVSKTINASLTGGNPAFWAILTIIFVIVAVGYIIYFSVRYIVSIYENYIK